MLLRKLLLLSSYPAGVCTGRNLSKRVAINNTESLFLFITWKAINDILLSQITENIFVKQ
ncbi:hypothetical protein MYP_351 [Sporocytophaga myxococcoides]|uniref:Uncharacterized protein n=1 Tax=Sporocytophaga myxococcoides TaxID=153721 RepID=A0A098L8J5_9BACT|nr:hypothetical protein MYP_351 [Sporocytophaga myxococcoides]